jgi:hypothetical protein
MKTAAHEPPFGNATAERANYWLLAAVATFASDTRVSGFATACFVFEMFVFTTVATGTFDAAGGAEARAAGGVAVAIASS